MFLNLLDAVLFGAVSGFIVFVLSFSAFKFILKEIDGKR